MSPGLQRLTGVALVLTALAVVLGAGLGDPTIESHDDKEKFVEQVGNAADRIPVIYAFQVVEVFSGLLAIAAGLGLYLLLRERARGIALAGLLLLVVSCVLVAGRAFVGAAMVRAADDYGGGGLAGIGSGSEDVLELIRVLAVVHFGYFLSAFATLGLGAAAFESRPSVNYVRDELRGFRSKKTWNPAVGRWLIEDRPNGHSNSPNDPLSAEIVNRRLCLSRLTD
jgi:hypothetical protein